MVSNLAQWVELENYLVVVEGASSNCSGCASVLKIVTKHCMPVFKDGVKLQKSKIQPYLRPLQMRLYSFPSSACPFQGL